MSGEYGAFLNPAANWITSFWSTPSVQMQELNAPLLAPETRIHELPTNMEDGIQMIQNPVQNQLQALDEIESKMSEPIIGAEEAEMDELNELLDSVLQDDVFGGALRGTSGGISSFGAAGYEEELVRREVQLGEEMARDVPELVRTAQAAGEIVPEVTEAVGDALAVADTGFNVALAMSVGTSLLSAGFTLGLSLMGDWLIDLSDQKWKDYLDEHHLGGHVTDGIDPDFPGRGFVCYAFFDTVALPATIMTDGQSVGWGEGIWLLNMKELSSYQRYKVPVHKSRINVVDPPIKGAVPAGMKPILRSQDGTMKIVHFFPLLALGTEVKTPSGQVGTITTTYDNNGKSRHPSYKVDNENDKKYGVSWEKLISSTKNLTRKEEQFFNVNELMVRNPVNARWEELKARAAEVKADLNRDPEPTVPPPFVPFDPDPSGVFGSGGWQGDFDPNSWSGIAETFEDADGQAQKQKDLQDKRDRRARDKINRHENWVMQQAYGEVNKEKIRLDNEEARAKFLASQKGIRTKSKIRKMKGFFDEVAAADAVRNTIFEDSVWPFDQRRRLPETEEDLEEEEMILPLGEHHEHPMIGGPTTPPKPSPRKEVSTGGGGSNGVAIVVGLIIVAYLFAES